jgi:hypothetical protein
MKKERKRVNKLSTGALCNASVKNRRLKVKSLTGSTVSTNYPSVRNLEK